MKSCSSNNGTPYSRPMAALVGSVWRVWLRNRRGVSMGRWVSLHRFAIIFCAGLLLVMATRGGAGPLPPASAEKAVTQVSPQQSGSSQDTASEANTTEQTKTEQYTLSHERQAKAVAYSQRGYTLYFLSYCLGGLFLFLLLRSDCPATYSQCADNNSEKKQAQDLVLLH